MKFLFSTKSFLKRSPKTHKGDYGRVLIAAGSRGMAGAANLSALAALRSGAGLVTLAVPDAIYNVTVRKDPEVMVRPFPATAQGTLDLKSFTEISKQLSNQDVLAMGPGLSRNSSTVKLIHKLILNTQIPMVIDADALNALEGKSEVLLRVQAPCILTPHAKEFERVFGLNPGKSDLERKEAARNAAETYGVFIVLKGHRTVVAAPNGKIFLNTSGNAGMATAGTGDVLTGMIAGLLGRRKHLFDTICLAVYAHGIAGDFAAQKKGRTALIARDILESLPNVFKKLERYS